MDVIKFIDCLKELNSKFFTGVPDSLLSPLCNYLMDTYGISDRHIIGANEGACVGFAAGYHLSTGEIPTVYLQNSGIGNIINPLASLLNDRVYGIPCIFVVGWRGEPGIKDEPQHVFQGDVTLSLLELMDVFTVVIDKNTTEEYLRKLLPELDKRLKEKKSIAFVVKKEALYYKNQIKYENKYSMKREDIIQKIVEFSAEDIIVSTTGKASRELFEIREKNQQSHRYDFLTVGSMGHSSSIALGIAKYKPKHKIWCLDGDGSALMHMGAMALIGSNLPNNLIHIVLNNGSHETVGGLPTVAENINLIQIAIGCGYPKAISVSNVEELNGALDQAKSSKQLMFIEIKTAMGSRKDLGRPTKTPMENKENFMNYLKE